MSVVWGVPDPKDTVLNKLMDTTFPFTEELGYFLYMLGKHFRDKDKLQTENGFKKLVLDDAIYYFDTGDKGTPDEEELISAYKLVLKEPDIYDITLLTRRRGYELQEYLELNYTLCSSYIFSFGYLFFEPEENFEKIICSDGESAYRRIKKYRTR